MNFFLELSLLGRIAFIATILAAIGTAYGLWHHSIYKSGEDACQARYAAAATSQASTAQKNIIKIGNSYEKIDQQLQRAAGFTLPASPLVISAIGKLPSPHPRAK